MDNCYGKVYPGQVAALLGPSGAGKSTLMNLLAARQSWNNGTVRPRTPNAPRMTSGEVRYGGVLLSEAELRDSVEYVLQHDALLASQTVFETLEFAAALKVPNLLCEETGVELRGKPCSYARKNADEIIRVLDLEEIRDVRIGGEMTPGISGGQRKRVSCGVSLVSRPAIVFLDEPTTGLDSYSSLQLVYFLKKFARQQNAIILATIHQPASELFDAFDQVMVLRQGKTLLHGLNGRTADAFLGGSGRLADRFRTWSAHRESKERRASHLSRISEEGRDSEVVLNLGSDQERLKKTRTIVGFLTEVLHINRVLLHGQNMAAFLLTLATGFTDRQAEMCAFEAARVFELHHGRKGGRPLLPGIDSVEQRLAAEAIGWDVVGGGNESPTLRSQSSSEPADASRGISGDQHSERSSRNTTVIMWDPDDNPDDQPVRLTQQECTPARILTHDCEIKCNLSVGCVPNALRTRHLNATWKKTFLSEHPEFKEVYKTTAPSKQANFSNFFCQFRFLTHRELTHLWRTPGFLLTRIIVPMVQILFIDTVFFAATRQMYSGLNMSDFSVGFEWLGFHASSSAKDKLGEDKLESPADWRLKLIEVFGAMGQPWFVLMGACIAASILAMTQDRVVFLREYTSGFYSITVFILSKFVLECLVILLQIVIILGLHWMLVGFAPPLFPSLLGLLFLHGLASSSLGLFIGALSADNAEQAFYWQPVFLLTLSSAFSGNFRPLNEIPWVMRWASYIYPMAFTGKALDYITFSQVGEQVSRSRVSKDSRTVLEEQRNKRFESRQLSEEGLWINFLGLFLVFVGYRFLAGAVLRLNSRTLY